MWCKPRLWICNMTNKVENFMVSTGAVISTHNCYNATHQFFVFIVLTKITLKMFMPPTSHLWFHFGSVRKHGMNKFILFSIINLNMFRNMYLNSFRNIILNILNMFRNKLLNILHMFGPVFLNKTRTKPKMCDWNTQNPLHK